MKIRIISSIVIAFLFLSANSEGDNLRKDSQLRIHLPREIMLDDSDVSLGQIGIIRGEKSFVAKASEIALGRISVPGQKIVVTRPLILSRLACNGIAASEVTLTGAEEIIVKQQQRVIKSSEFIEAASSFLEKNLPDDSICEFKATRMPKDFIVQGECGDVKLSAHLAKSGARSQAKVRVVVFSDGREIGSREVSFRFKYSCHRIVALVDIPREAVISSENVKIEKGISNYPETSVWSRFSFLDTSQDGVLTVPYGLVANRRIPANTVVRPEMVGPVKPQLVVKRNQNVVIRINTSGLLVTANGKALEDGRVGEYIKVKMQISNESQRTIIVKVKEDGMLEPIF